MEIRSAVAAGGTSIATQTTGRPVIEIRSLSKFYKGSGGAIVRAVDALSLSIPQGQVIGLLGPNGAGKTTTIKLMCGLVTPTAGSVRLNGYDIGRQRSLAVLQLGNVYWSLSNWQNLLYFGRLKGLRGGEIRPRAERLLRDLGLWEVRKGHVGGFSRGMQQKVAVAAALIADPPILLLDEPTIGLDVEAARTVKDWIVRLAREQGKTVVLTTHQLDMAQELCDRVAIMRGGRVAADMPVQDLLGRFRQDRYRIALGTCIDLSGGPLPDGITVSQEDGATILTASNLDSPGLYRLMAHLHQLGLPLRSVSPVEPDLEEAFLELVRAGTTND